MEAIRRKHHETMNNLLEYLGDKSWIGIVGAVIAYTLSSINWLFDENVLRMAGGAGIYIGLFVATLTGILKLLDLYDNIKKRFK